MKVQYREGKVVTEMLHEDFERECLGRRFILSALPDSMVYREESGEVLWKYIRENGSAWKASIELDDNRCIRSIILPEGVDEWCYEILADDLEAATDGGLKNMLRGNRLAVCYCLKHDLTAGRESGGWLVEITEKEITRLYEILNSEKSLNDIPELNVILDRAFAEFLQVGLMDFKPEKEYMRLKRKDESLPAMEEYAEREWGIGFWFGDVYDEFEYIANA